MSIFLISPPFAHPRAPLLAVPTLASYLRSQGIEVTALDAGIEFFHYFLTSKNIEAGRRFGKERFEELNSQSELSDYEKRAYFQLASMLLAPENQKDAHIVFDKNLPAQRFFSSLYAAVTAASAPYFPEKIEMQIFSNIVGYQSAFSNYSTDDILMSTEGEGMLSGFFEEILPGPLENSRPGIVGISVAYADQVQAAFRCARVVKQIMPEAHITIGGSFVSSAMRELSNPRIFEFIDSMILDDGEISLERLAREVARSVPDFTKIPGLVYYDGTKIRKNASDAPLDMETLLPPDYSVINLDRYLSPLGLRFVPVRSSRGCRWARCAFCNTRMPAVCQHQQLSGDHIYEVVRAVTGQAGVKVVSFADDASSPVEMEAFSRRLNSDKLTIYWGINSRIEQGLSMERFRLYRRAGCVNINFGLESYNDRILKLINKGTNKKTIDFVLSNTLWSDIHVLTYLIVGLPTETEQEALEGFRKITKMQSDGLIDDYVYCTFQLFPDSTIFREQERFGIKRFSIPKGQDLNGPISDFDVEGMSRETARRLGAKFNTERLSYSYPQKIIIDRRSVEIRHELKQIMGGI